MFVQLYLTCLYHATQYRSYFKKKEECSMSIRGQRLLSHGQKKIKNSLTREYPRVIQLAVLHARPTAIKRPPQLPNPLESLLGLVVVNAIITQDPERSR